MTAGAGRAVGGELPRRLVGVGDVAVGAGEGGPMITGVFRRGVHELHRCPVGITVAGGAVLAGSHVVGHLTEGDRTVMAALAGTGRGGVIKFRRRPGEGVMAVPALLGRRNVIPGQRRRTNAHMASTTRCLGDGGNGSVVHALRAEGHGGMARIAVVVGWNVVWSLAFGDDAVVAAEAGSTSGAVIHLDQRPEVIARMAQVAPVGAGDVINRLRRRADAAARCMAALAGTWRALEDSVDVTVLTREVAVRAQKLKPGRQVIEARVLDG